MRRRDFLAASIGAAGGLGWSTGALAAAVVGIENGEILRTWMQRWLAAFNAPDPAVYRSFIATAMPDGLPYVDDDLSVRDSSGGFDLIRSEVTGSDQITAWVKDRNWDRFSKILLSATSAKRISDVAFRGAGPPADFVVARLSQREALGGFDRKLRALAATGPFAGAVLVAREGRVVFRRAYGLADLDHGLRGSPATRYCIGSMGKMFTAVAVLQLAQAGRVRLSDPLSAYLPDYPNADLARKVTIEHLLTHTGGTGDIFGPSYDGHKSKLDRPADFIRAYGQRKALFEPGSKWDYSNYGFILLGAVIEQASGRPYEAWYEDHIFRPAGMTRTSQAASPGDTAIAYSGTLRAGLKPIAPYVGAPAGGGYSTVDDLHAFATAIRAGRLLDAERVGLLVTGRVDAGGVRQAMGFVVKTRNGVSCYGHGGSAPGVNGDLSIFPRSGYETILLCNRGYPVALSAAEYIGARLPAGKS